MRRILEWQDALDSLISYNFLLQKQNKKVNNIRNKAFLIDFSYCLLLLRS